MAAGLHKHAVVGSRGWQRPQEVALHINELYTTYGSGLIVVSGGADDVDVVAEETAREFGLPVISFRPVKVNTPLDQEDEYAVEEWRLYRGTGTVIRHTGTWGDWRSAAFWRNKLIAERADEGTAFWDGSSRGTSDAIDAFAAEGKPLKVIQ